MPEPMRPLSDQNGWLYYPFDTQKVDENGNSMAGRPIPWEHFITKSSVSSEGSIGYGEGGNHFTRTIFVNFTDLYDVMEVALGINRYAPAMDNPDDPQGSTGPGFTRVLPLRDLFFPNFYCSGIQSIRPYHWLKKAPCSVLDINNNPIGNDSFYDRWVMVLNFSVPKYIMLSDADLDAAYPPVTVPGFNNPVRQEWRRFVIRRPDMAGSVLTRPVGSFKWAENQRGLMPPFASIAGTAFPSDLGQFVGHVDYELVWENVPSLGLYSGATNELDVPINIFNGLGCLNDAEFMGAPTGTLLLRSVKIAPMESPNYRDVPINQLTGQQMTPPLLNRVIFGMSVFDPPSGNGTFRGWNLHPNPADNLWYMVTHNGTLPAPFGTGRPLYPYYSFELLFAPTTLT
jgi:hypothetical protein